MGDDNIEELVQFLTPDTPTHLKKLALENLIGLTATTEGHLFFLKHLNILTATIKLTADKTEEIAGGAFTALVNLSADDVLAEKLVEADNSALVKLLLQAIFRRVTNPHVEFCCKILNNLTTRLNCSHKIFEVFSEMNHDLGELVTLFCDEKFNNDYHYLSGFFCNVSHLIDVRRRLMKNDGELLKRLIPFMGYEKSDVRREGIAGMIKNCCFDTDLHELLLDDNLELLVYLLLPLAGPEEFDDDEMATLPLELQYLGESKRRDCNCNVRKFIVEALTQLCATKKGRQILKDKNVYLILRELHNWEKVPTVKLSCENLVQILISDEPPYDNLKDVDIPNDLVDKFDKMDVEALKDAENDLEAETKPTE